MPRNWSRQTSLWFPRRLSVPSSETRNTVDLAPRAPSCHKLRLASAHTPSKSVSGFLACAEPTASASWPAHRSRAGRPDTPANPAPCSSPPLSSCRVYPESPKIKTPIPSAGLTVSRSEPNDHCSAPFSEPLWLVGPTKVYSDLGADIVMESMSLIDHTGSLTLVTTVALADSVESGTCLKCLRQKSVAMTTGRGQSVLWTTRGFTVNGATRDA